MPGPLPDEKMPPVTWRGLGLTLAVPIFALLLINAVLVLFPLPLDFRVSAHKWALAERAGSDIETVVLGDSTGNMGVDPSVLAKAFGGQAINLCTYGQLRALDDAWLLQEFLVRGGRPKRILVVHAYDVWAGDLDPSLTAPYPLPRIFRRGYRPGLDLDFPAHAHLLFQKYFPLYGQSAVIKQVILDPLWLKRWNVDIYSLDGFNPYRKPAKPAKVMADTRKHLRDLETPSHIVSPINVASLRVLGELAEQYDFDVHIATGPLYEGLADSPKFIRHHDSLRLRIEEISGEPSRIRYLTPEPIRFPSSRMINADHIVRDATEDYTQQLIERMREMER